MRKDTPDDVTSLELLAEMRAMIDAARQVIEGSQAAHDGPAGESAAAPVSSLGADVQHDPVDLLGDISDSLLDAYQLAKHDGDPLTIALIEKVLFHVGRRLARGMSPAEAGIPCH
ncbi:hypothetical protein JHFBIEKO_3766 [Methylobacterium mesophilicum]|jgi:hypothetical protein|uniref:hypothetical protein n=2 Tax=Methylobacteriaceae TaxID=119045 RepID=UPI001EE1CCBD|nr:hypothetical protein [Methylobacterium mesophilicum]GJE23304.1 hypothetical protein JHFBIEKO_3766 [Methylobacterium mesophilicum]